MVGFCLLYFCLIGGLYVVWVTCFALGLRVLMVCRVDMAVCGCGWVAWFAGVYDGCLLTRVCCVVFNIGC